MDDALRLQWTFGFNNKITGGVHNLSDANRIALFYVSAHSGVIYDAAARTQQLLQGHKNPITATCVSADKRIIVTADSGVDALLAVWDATTGLPLKSFFNPGPGGVVAVDISGDGRYLATLSADSSQAQVCEVWAWTDASAEGPMCSVTLPNSSSTAAGTTAAMTSTAMTSTTMAVMATSADRQHCVKFNPSNPRDLMCNGHKTAFFLNWQERETDAAALAASGSSSSSVRAPVLEAYAPKLNRSKFGQPVGIFTASTFITQGRAVTGTRDGDVLVWGRNPEADTGVTANSGDDDDGSGNGERAAAKLIRLGEGALTVVGTCEQKYLVLAGEDGAVRFYDMQFRLEAWFEDLDAGAVTSVSFAATSQSSQNQQQQARLDFNTPDFVVGTRNAYIVHLESALFDEVEPSARRGALIVQGMPDEVHGVAMHPHKAQLAIACYNGAVYLWDLDTKVLLMVRQFDASKLRPRTLAYDPTGAFLLAGFTSGTVKLLDPTSLDDVATFKNGRDPITLVSFAPRGDFFATADAGYYVALYRLVLESHEGLDNNGQSNDSLAGGSIVSSASSASSTAYAPRVSWSYIGRYRSHSAPITGLSFGLREQGGQSLVSVGEDRQLVEYDLEESCVEEGLLLMDDPLRLEQTAVPTALCWHPLLGEGDKKDFEDRFVTANSDYKLLEWNADNKACRKTSLAPSFGGPLAQLMPLVPETPPPPGGAQPLDPQVLNAKAKAQPLAAYACAERVVGLVKMPLDGNPAKSMGVVAHPGGISALCTSFDTTLLATAGGADASVNLWSVHPECVEAAEAASFVPLPGEVMSQDLTTASLPWVRLLGGADPATGELDELVNFFVYSQLRTQGEDTTAPRDISGSVPLSEIPGLMSAMGFYPPAAQAAAMVSEVQYSAYTSLGIVKEQCTLAEFVKLYANHRPVFGLDKAEIDAAIALLARTAASEAAAKLEADAKAQAEADLNMGVVSPLGGLGGDGHSVGSGTASLAEEVNALNEMGARGEIEWAALKALLVKDGDALKTDELSSALKALVGIDDLPEGALNAQSFVGQVLGLEEGGDKEDGEGTATK